MKFIQKKYRSNEKSAHDNIIVDDDVFSEAEKDAIKSKFYDPYFPWYTCPAHTLTSDLDVWNGFRKITNNIFEYTQFVHQFVVEGNDNSAYSEFVRNILDKVKEKYNLSGDLIRIKANFTTKVYELNDLAHQTPHIDSTFEHWVILYYVEDSDGDTFIFDQKMNNNSEISNIKELTIKKRVSPKKGRVVIFNGRFLHAGMHPRNHNHRIIINFNLKNNGN